MKKIISLFILLSLTACSDDKCKKPYDEFNKCICEPSICKPDPWKPNK